MSKLTINLTIDQDGVRLYSATSTNQFFCNDLAILFTKHQKHIIITKYLHAQAILSPVKYLLDRIIRKVKSVARKLNNL